eukprot:14283878-Alexandrium_andersonii.AAC.1
MPRGARDTPCETAFGQNTTGHTRRTEEEEEEGAEGQGEDHLEAAARPGLELLELGALGPWALLRTAAERARACARPKTSSPRTEMGAMLSSVV